MMQPVDIQRVFIRPVSNFLPVRGFFFFRASKRGRRSLSGNSGTFFKVFRRGAGRIRRGSITYRGGWIFLTVAGAALWCGVGAGLAWEVLR